MVPLKLRDELARLSKSEGELMLKAVGNALDGLPVKRRRRQHKKRDRQRLMHRWRLKL
ncbi:hypothetical protein [Bradyrhizobium sp. McL0616]|uniref:hypothetical protein n=1 Tax=Bradyrhizobium sp. McL0616 TaxID=3415674 RepID=UPI003CF16A45